MLPYILAAVGGYLIGDSMKDKQVFADGGEMAKGGLSDRYSTEVGDEVLTFIKNGKEVSGYPVYVRLSGYAPITVGVFPTKEKAIAKAKELEKKNKMADGGTTVIDEYGSTSFRNQYNDYEMIVVSKELEKDGGGVIKDRFLVSARNIDEAKQIATDLWKKQYSDESDLTIVKVMSEELYRLKYMNQYADGGMTPKENLIRELQKLQRDLNSRRLQTYIEGDTSDEEMARQKEREVKLKRFNEILETLKESEKMADGGKMEEEFVSYSGSLFNPKDVKYHKTKEEAEERVKSMKGERGIIAKKLFDLQSKYAVYESVR